MSAEVLREAAALMRERAEAATSGRPYWHEYGNGGRTLAVAGPLLGGYPTHELNILKTTDDWPPTDADAEHIASWYPAVALAVADWLDAVGKHMQTGRAKGNPKAVAVARAYLGSPS